MRNRKLGRTTAQRRAMLRGMVTLLLECGKIETTYTRAQEVSAKADEMITLGKKGDLAAYRAALEYITKEDVAKKLFSTVAPAYAEMTGENEITLEFDEPQRAPAKGQSAVLYDGDLVIGGGIIR